MSILTDSISPASKYLPKGTKITHGRIHKGHSKIAASASIPSKYQTIVISKEERKGFSSGTKRFSELNFSDGPGPANYSVTQSLSSQDHVSHSKKGLGGFASKAKRFSQPWNEEHTVGPGQYEAHRMTSKKDFNKASCTSNFHRPIAVNNDKNRFRTPAPNQYNITNNVSGKTTRENNVGACAAFSSKTKRGYLEELPKKSVPAPGAYNISDLWDTGKNARGTQAPFKSTTERCVVMNKASVENPGPGSYNPYEKQIFSDNRKNLPRKHYLCISAPAMTMPPEPDAPGPGQYDLVNYDGDIPQFAASSMFVSTTNRWNSKRNKSAPGPGTYTPHHIGKVSFLYNADKKWI